jgi:hypothetical protein
MAPQLKRVFEGRSKRHLMVVAATAHVGAGGTAGARQLRRPRVMPQGDLGQRGWGNGGRRMAGGMPPARAGLESWRRRASTQGGK